MEVVKTRPESCQREPARSRSSKLPGAMLAQRRQRHGRHGDHASAFLRLRWHAGQLAVHSLQDIPDGDQPGLKVHILPGQPQRLPLPETEREGDGVQGFEPLPAYRPQERSRFSGGKKSWRWPGALRRVHQCGDIARAEPPAKRLIQRATEHGAMVLNGARRETGRVLPVHVVLDIVRTEFAEGDATKPGNQVPGDDHPVAFEGPRPKPRLRRFLESASEELVHRLAALGGEGSRPSASRVNIGLLDPVAQRLIGDAQLTRELGDALAAGAGQFDRFGPELGWAGWRVFGIWTPFSRSVFSSI